MHCSLSMYSPAFISEMGCMVVKRYCLMRVIGKELQSDNLFCFVAKIPNALSFSPFSQYYRDFFSGNGFKSFYSTPSVTRTGTQRNKTPDRQTVSNTNVTYSSILVLQVPAPVCGLAKPELKKLDNDLGNSLRCLPIIICCGYRADKDENI